jgi:hypothetical protein
MSQYTVDQALADAVAHQRAGRLGDAEGLYRRILAVAPNHPDALHLLGLVAHDIGRQDAALDLVTRAIGIAPNQASYYNTLGEIHRVSGRLEEAMAAYQKALVYLPNMPEPQLNMGIVHAHRNQLPQAIACFERAIALRPDFAEAHDGLGLALLTLGDLQRGWREQEWRWKKRKFPSPKRSFDKPQWEGDDPAGKTILIHTEQGLGDSIQFCRYVPMVAKLGARVIFEVPPELFTLMQTLPGVDQLIKKHDPIPAFDVHCPLLSLPKVMGTTLETIPRDIHYLQADPAKIARWREKIKGPQLKVAIAWAGSPVHTNDVNRSTRLADFAPLAQAGNVTFYSMQKGDAARQATHPPAGMKLIDISADLTDFSETAAAVTCMDLVIAVDTAPVHIAGVIGKSVWVLLAFMPDWRWLLDRSDTPWYPSMRFFRQKALGDWPGAIREAAEALKQLARERTTDATSGDMPPQAGA